MTKFAKSVVSVCLAGLVFASLLTDRLWADPSALRLEPMGLDAQGQPTLRVNAGSSVPVALQVSTDLRGWYTMTNTLVLTNRSGTTIWETTFTDLAPGSSRAAYYRALVPQAPLDVALKTDPNWTVAALITTNGGTASLNLPNQTRITLTVPPLAVDADTVVRMTWVTNVVGAPSTAGPADTILLEPEGLVLQAPALLELAFATNSAPALAQAFSCNGDGTDFHLIASRAGSDTVRISLNHFSGYDIRSIGEAQLATAVARNTRGIKASLERDIAAILSAERYHQLLGDEPPDATVDELNSVGSLLMQYYKRALKPYLATAESNCPLLHFLAKEILSTLRQLNLLGLADDPEVMAATAELAPHLRAGIENCMNAILEKCQAGDKSTEAVAELLSYERQAEILGTPTSHTGPEIFEACGPGNWTGTLLYEESGATNEIIYDGGTSSPRPQAGMRERSFHYRIEGSVEGVTENLSPGFVAVTVKLVAPVTGGQQDRQNAVFQPDCEGAEVTHPPGRTLATSLDLVASVTNHFQLDMMLMSPPIANPGLTNLTFTLPPLNLAGRFIDLSRADSPDCETAGVTSNVSDPRVLQVTPPAYSSSSPAYATQVSSNIVKVAGFGTRTQDGLPTSWSLQLEFKRKL